MYCSHCGERIAPAQQEELYLFLKGTCPCGHITYKSVPRVQ